MKKLSFLAHEKLKKVITKCKADAAMISDLKSQITDLEDEARTQREKFENSHEAQKLASVKVSDKNINNVIITHIIYHQEYKLFDS